MSNITIPFVNNYDVDNLILKSFIEEEDISTWITLSEVNQAGYQFFSNHTVFQDLFNKYGLFILHRAVGQQETFEHLKEMQPNSVWKIACCILQKNRITIPRNSFKYVRALVLKCYINTINKKIQSREEELIKLCGSGYGDPNSELDKAWKNYNDLTHLNIRPLNCDSFDNFDVKFKELKENALKIHQSLEEDRQDLVKSIKDFREWIVSAQNGEREQPLIHFYAIAIQNAVRDLCLAKTPALEVTYYSLVRDREIPNVLTLVHQEILFDTNNPIALEEIRIKINQLSDNPAFATYIWQTLYDTCANFAIEEQWSEKHFQDYLPELLELIKTICTNYQLFMQNFIGVPPIPGIVLSIGDRVNLLLNLKRIWTLIEQKITHQKNIMEICHRVDCMGFARYIRHTVYDRFAKKVEGHSATWTEEKQWFQEHIHEHLPILSEILEDLLAKQTKCYSLAGDPARIPGYVPVIGTYRDLEVIEEKK